MLVLTRRADQKIVFPSLGITIQILRVRGNIVKVGIDAPAEIPVLRHELSDGCEAEPPVAKNVVRERIREARHQLKNRLNSVVVALHLYRRQLENGLAEGADSTFDKIIDQFATLEREFAGSQEMAVRLSGIEQAIAQLRHDPSGETRQALLVEDDANESELLAGFLRLSGYEVITAGDGAAALEYLKSHKRPEVVLLDMKMPRCDGPTTIELIRRDPDFDGLKVFAISGSAPSEVGVSIGPKGIDRWFSKPLNPEQLLHEMDKELKPAEADC